jgi:hypothetical protein
MAANDAPAAVICPSQGLTQIMAAGNYMCFQSGNKYAKLARNPFTPELDRMKRNLLA